MEIKKIFKNPISYSIYFFIGIPLLIYQSIIFSWIIGINDSFNYTGIINIISSNFEFIKIFFTEMIPNLRFYIFMSICFGLFLYFKVDESLNQTIE